VLLLIRQIELKLNHTLLIHVLKGIFNTIPKKTQIKNNISFVIYQNFSQIEIFYASGGEFKESTAGY